MLRKLFSTSLMLAIFFSLIASPGFVKEPESGGSGSKELESRGVGEVLGEPGRPVLTPTTVAPAISTPTPMSQETLEASMTKLKDQVAKLNDQIGVASASVTQLKANADSINKQVLELSAQLGIAQPKKDQH